MLFARPIHAQLLPNDHALGYKVGVNRAVVPPGTTFPKGVTRAVSDEFGSRICTFTKEKTLYAPAEKNGEPVQHPTRHYVGYQTKCTPRVVGGATYFDQFFPSGVPITALKESHVLVPAGKSTTLTIDPPPPGPGTNHYLCYKAKAPKLVAPPTVTVVDQFGTRQVTLTKVRSVCNPADKDANDPGAITDPDHYLCYKLKAAKPAPVTVRTNNLNFGANTLATKGYTEFCVPASRLGPPPTVTTTTSTTTTISGTTTTAPSGTTTSTTTTTGVPTTSTTHLDHFHMYTASGPDGPMVTLSDVFQTQTVDLGPVFSLAAPVDKNGEGISDEVTHETCYGLNGSAVERTIDITNQFGPQLLEVGPPIGLCVPTEKEPLAPSPVPLPRDHFKCYFVNGPTPGVTVTLQDQFQTQSSLVQAAIGFCTPVDKNGEGILRPDDHLTCYQITSPFAGGATKLIRNQFHQAFVNITYGFFELLCVPSTMCGDGVLSPGEVCELPPLSTGCGASEVCDGCTGCAPCPAATVIPPTGGSFAGSTTGGSSIFGSCAGSAAAPERLFEWTPSVSGTWTIDTCRGNRHDASNTVVYIREGTCPSFGTELACNDDAASEFDFQCGGHASRITPTVVAGQTYTIFVDSNFSGNAVDFHLNVYQCGDGTCTAGETPCNCPDDCPNDPDACEGCECGTVSQNCGCDDACAHFGDCCENVFSGVCCGGGDGPNGTCDDPETVCNCNADCPNNLNTCEACECGYHPEYQTCGCDPDCWTNGDCCVDACTGMCGECCGDGACGMGETPCNCADDCPNDLNACEACECGDPALYQTCGCDAACVDFNDCCANTCAMCGYCP